MGLNTGLVVVGRDRRQPAHGLHGGRRHDASRRPPAAGWPRPAPSCISEATAPTRRSARSRSSPRARSPLQGLERARHAHFRLARARGRRRSALEQRPIGGLGAASSGREREMRDARRAVRPGARRDGGGSWAWSASRGSGKSRLLLRVPARRCGGRASRVPRGALPVATAPPCRTCPSSTSCAAHCGIADVDPPEVAADKVRAALDELGVERRDRAPYLLHLLGLKEGDARQLGCAEPGRRRQGADPRARSGSSGLSGEPRASARHRRRGPALDRRRPPRRPSPHSSRVSAAPACSSSRPTGPATVRPGLTDRMRRRSRSGPCAATSSLGILRVLLAGPRLRRPARRAGPRQGRGEPVLPRGALPRRQRSGRRAGSPFPTPCRASSPRASTGSPSGPSTCS